MKVLFLDIDGVLNSTGSFFAHAKLKLLGLTDIPSHEHFCPTCASNLEYILKECPDVQVVVSSTWRKYNSIESLKRIFEKNKILLNRIIGVTPESEDGYRGKEVEAYLKGHPEVTTFAILDDNSDMKPYMDHLVQTDGRNGLTWTDAEKVIKMLGGKNEKESG